MSGRRVLIFVGAVVVAILGLGGWLWATAGRETTDDAQVDAHVTPIAARVGGTVLKVSVTENQEVEAGTVLVEIDRRDFELELERRRAELADAEAAAMAARAGVPITSTTATSQVSSARGGIEQADASVREAEQAIDAAKARLVTAQARLREAQSTASRTARDVERFKPLLAKDEISQQQFDAAAAAADAASAGLDSTRAQITEAELAVRVAESRLTQARVARQTAAAGLATAETAPSQIAASKARADAADARVRQAQAVVQQAELNIEYATVKAATKGVVSKKSIEPGQIVQPGQPLMALIPLERVWITANFKETQLEHMRVGQRVTIEVDAYGGREFTGRIESVAPATGARFSLLPPDNATGNFVKVVQRVPVRITLDAGQDPEHLLRPGMSVEPTVYTRE
jgi:membrane fusion protein (multidrug efflux system)